MDLQLIPGNNQVSETPQGCKLCAIHSGIESRIIYLERNAQLSTDILQRIAKLEARITLMVGLGMPLISGGVSLLVYFLTKG